jgi:enamine deaminase RidA (YjgF/YER057c/UK114 family)
LIITLSLRIQESASASEIFVTAGPSGRRPLQQQAREVFEAVAETLRGAHAHILQERIFGVESAFASILPVRAVAYGDLDDGGPPVLLAVPEGPDGALAGVQIHAVRASSNPKVLRCGKKACGRMLRAGGYDYVALSGLVAPEAGAAPAQARAVFEKAEAALRKAGGDMFSVVRTWLWLGDILSWYGEFNRVRSGFFTERGLLDGDPQHSRLPASTGIGVGPAGGARCALDVIAVIGQEAGIEYFRGAGRQHCAYNYGSAFSRVARAITPAGRTVYVSGTAAIDAAGRTQHVGDAAGQIKMTIDNVRAALKDADCTDDDVVYAIVYSKTPDVEKLFRERWAGLPWPYVSILSDICREDLLFEVEAAACPGARKA